MRLIGWAIALAAAGLTPAAAQAPASAPTETAAPAAPAATPAPAPAPAPIVYGSVGHQIPNPTIGMPQPGGIGIEEQVTPLGQRAAHFHDFWLMWTISLISAFVLILLVVTIIRFRRSANPTPSRNSHNTLIEVVWTLVPVLILLAIALPSIRLLRDQYTFPPADLTVKITGHQWYWSYEYPDYGVSYDSNILKEKGDPALKPGDRYRTDQDGPPLLAADERLVIPAGKVVKLQITADDVIHSFSVPAFWTKLDANPGQLNETWVKIDANRTGVYFGQCSELCGARHGYMPINVEVVTPAQFEQWIASKGGTKPGAKPAAAESNGTAAAAAPQSAADTAKQPATNQAATAQN
ncbi:MAG TPA: cytochrome c oxidase subunit II [Sphingomicrobium sp.]|nr:cytochrome c oxidase subunit II [Sphingomicrobium sp.]